MCILIFADWYEKLRNFLNYVVFFSCQGLESAYLSVVVSLKHSHLAFDTKPERILLNVKVAYNLKKSFPLNHNLHCTSQCTQWMTAMVEQVGINPHIDTDYVHEHDDDENSIPEVLRASSGLIMESLDKLTNEIKEDLDQESVTGYDSSSNDDDDAYWSDEDNYDSGENKLFAMMDELVNELKIEIEDDKDNDDGVEGGRIVETGEGIVTEAVNENTAESDDQPSVVSASSDEGDSPTSDVEPKDEAVEKQEKLHQHVKTLLEQVYELTGTMNTMKKTKAVKNEYNDKVSASIQKKIENGDYDADRLEHLMGAIATYSKFREAKINAIPTISSPSPQSSSTVKLKKNRRKKRTNKHKRRRSKSFVQTQQSLLILSDSLAALDAKLSQEKN